MAAGIVAILEWRGAAALKALKAEGGGSSQAPSRALLLAGTGRAFSTGQDLNERILPNGEIVVPGEALEKFYNPLVLKLRALPFPVVCAVNGVCAGASCNIALGCDIVVAARNQDHYREIISASRDLQRPPLCLVIACITLPSSRSARFRREVTRFR